MSTYVQPPMRGGIPVVGPVEPLSPVRATGAARPRETSGGSSDSSPSAAPDTQLLLPPGLIPEVTTVQCPTCQGRAGVAPPLREGSSRPAAPPPPLRCKTCGREGTVDIAWGTSILDDTKHAWRVNEVPLWPLISHCDQLRLDEAGELTEAIGRLCVPCTTLIIPPGSRIEKVPFDHGP